MKKKPSPIMNFFKYSFLTVSFTIALFLIYQVDSLPFIFKISIRFSKLLIMVAIACFVGSLLELRSWNKFINFIALPFIKFGRLPELSGTSFITAIVSNNAAGSMIASSFSAGKMSRLQLWTSAVCNSYIAMVSHSLRIAIPFIATLGITGIIYYSITFGCGLIICLIFLILSRNNTPKQTNENIKFNNDNKMTKLTSWPKILKLSFSRTIKMICRLLLITAPLYFIAACLVKQGFFKQIETYLPQQIQFILTGEIMTIITARLGGMVNAGMVGKELLNQHSITSSGILIALIAGNIITNPIRLIRRNLPTALGVYGKDGAGIVITIQSLRLIMMISVLLFILIFTK